MSGLLALLDDVAGIAKVAAASVDDVTGMAKVAAASVDDVAAHAAKAGAKAAGAVIDDAAVTPKYVHGFDASRELPIVWRIARGSIFNKLVLLLPVALLLSAFAPFAVSPLLMLGGCYLCFEGAEKVWHRLHPHAEPEAVEAGNPTQLEETRVKGAIKTDFILSAEIMTIALASIPVGDSMWMKAMVLALVAVAITAVVYGFVAAIVKADDVGLAMARRGGATRRLGIGVVRVMPGFMRALTAVGTAAMIWVGGNIVIHGLGALGWHAPADWIGARADAVAAMPTVVAGAARWATTAALDGVFGLALGLLLLPLVAQVLAPLWSRLTGGKGKPAH